MSNPQKRAARRLRVALGALVLLALVAALPALAAVPDYVRLNLAHIQLNHSLGTADGAALDRVATVLAAETGTPHVSQRAWRGLALAHMAAGRPAESAAAWQRVGGGAAELMLWAQQTTVVGDWATARERYELAVRLDPDNGDVWYELANAAAQLGAPDAFDLYGRALAAPNHTRYGISNILTRRGQLARDASSPDWATALSEFEEALRRDAFVESGDADDRLQARLGQAEALDRLGRPAEALAAYRRAAADAPDHYWSNVHSGRLTWAVERDAARAAAFLQHAITLNRNTTWAYLFLSDVYAESGQTELARPLLEQILTTNPADEAAKARLERLTGNNGP